ncbi:DUF1049 domain-containing protein [Candidatus Dependentiae bacterium]|nr:DUF1049 domain-containing protein [Candidatus Dependentiae bacterium]
MKFLKWLFYVIIVILLGFLFIEFSKLNQQLLTIDLKWGNVELDITTLILVSIGIGLLVGVVFLLLSLVFGALKDVKKIRRDKRERKYRHLISDAKDNFWKRNYLDASNLNNKALKVKSEANEALINLANLQLATGDTGKAIQIFEKIHRLNPEDLTIVHKLLDIYLKGKMYGEALQLAKETFEADETNLGIIFIIKDIYINLGDSEKAREYHDMVIKRIKKLSKHEAKFFNLKEEEKVLAKILYELGSKNFKLANYEEAIKNLQNSISLDKDYLPSYLKTGEIYRTNGDTKKAIDILKTGLSRKISYALCKNLENIYIKEDKPNDAIKYFTTLFQKYPESEMLVIFLAKLFLRLEMMDRVKEFIDKLTVMNKTSHYIPRLLNLLNIRELPGASSELKESLGKELVRDEYLCDLCGFKVMEYSSQCPNCKEFNVFSLNLS